MLAAAVMVLPKSSICSHVKGKSMNEIARVGVDLAIDPAGIIHEAA